MGNLGGSVSELLSNAGTGEHGELWALQSIVGPKLFSRRSGAIERGLSGSIGELGPGRMSDCVSPNLVTVSQLSDEDSDMCAGRVVAGRRVGTAGVPQRILAKQIWGREQPRNIYIPKSWRCWSGTVFLVSSFGISEC